VKLVVPSKNGIHIITSPFDTRVWNTMENDICESVKKYGIQVDLELKKDAMVNLIYPSED
jgi:hypothetical protein